ncbi:hypothetical protein CBW46_003935 [Paenibacillus xerothermodurans]|uniref:Uncharacterized protein n=2 Tax=Paenibacillus xerothermodurans TaxID=1977292 RepID=A0A2W1ND95_PAEXE|nr:hypothetical protein CBW46_003935 [Paenibacillus xerothermodurans]
MQREDVEVYVCGGARPEANSKTGLVGPLAEQLISQLRANISFIGTQGIELRVDRLQRACPLAPASVCSNVQNHLIRTLKA